MVAFVIQVNTPPDPSTEQVKVASSPGWTHKCLGDNPVWNGSLVLFGERIDFCHCVLLKNVNVYLFQCIYTHSLQVCPRYMYLA